MSDAVVASSAVADDALRFEVINQVGVITLNRPKALNALSHDMMRGFMPLLDRCESDPGIRAVLIRGTGPKAFCAGGDVVAVVDSVRAGTALQRDFFIDEYRVDHRLHRFPKPVVAFMHGIVMGGGMGLAQGAALRLVTDHTRIAMPETRIGLIPDVGATHFFGRLPAPLALYLGLTGVTLHAADALFAGLADARAAVAQPEDLDAALARIEWGPDALAALRGALVRPAHATHIDGATLPARCPAIYRHFDPARPVREIVASLEQETDPADAEWARGTLELLRARSPLMLGVCRAALARGRRLGLAPCFRLEYELVQAALASGEFTEGVRAFLIDKDHAPRWNPPQLDAVGDAQVEALLAAAEQASTQPAHPLAALHDD